MQLRCDSLASHGLSDCGSFKQLFPICASLSLVLVEVEARVLLVFLLVVWLAKQVLCCTRSRLYQAAEHATGQTGTSAQWT